MKTLLLLLSALAAHAQTPTGLIRAIVIQPGTSAMLANLSPAMNPATTPSLLLVYVTVLNPTVGQTYSFTIAGVTVKGVGFSMQGAVNSTGTAPATCNTVIATFEAPYGDTLDIVGKPLQPNINISVPTPAATVVVN